MIKIRRMDDNPKLCEDFHSLAELDNWFKGKEHDKKELKKVSRMLFSIYNGHQWLSISTNMFDSPYENLAVLIMAWKHVSDEKNRAH